MSGFPKADTTSGLSIYLRLLRYVLPYWGLFAISLLGFLLFASTQPMLGYILKFFVDGLNNPDARFFARAPPERAGMAGRTEIVAGSAVADRAHRTVAGHWLVSRKLFPPVSRWGWFTICASRCSTTC